MAIRYIKSLDDASIAIHTDGDDALPVIVLVSPWATATLTSVLGASLLDQLTPHRRVIRWDRRGTGLSTRDVADVGLEAQISDLAAIVDTLRLATFDLHGSFDGAPIAISYAARFPERIRKLSLWQPFVDGRHFLPPERVRSLIELAHTDWHLALRTMSTIWMPRASGERQRYFARSVGERVTPDIFVRSLEAVQATDVSREAPLVRSETLVLSPTGAGLPLRPAQETAALIPAATLHQIEQEVAYLSEPAFPVLLRFLGIQERVHGSLSHTTALILFADIADSTGLTERIGDAAFREKARALDEALRSIVRENGGSAIDGKLLGDGILATFAAASQAITAALAYEAAAGPTGLGLHVGLHAGDVLREANNVYGGAVNIASRISALAAPGEVLVSRTVADLARTSAGVVFEDRGEQTLKGVAEPQRVFAVEKDGE